jgi:hypothetical protein
MAWRFGGGSREKDQAKDEPAPKETRLTGKDLDRARELVKEMIEADRECVERYSIIPPTFPGTK